jgi:hypothetical protein
MARLDAGEDVSVQNAHWRYGLSLALTLFLVSACAPPTAVSRTIAPITRSPTSAPAATTVGRAVALPLGCPDPAQASISSATRISVQSDHGPVGTRVTVTITGARANCHLTLNIAAPPTLSETNNTPETKPGLSYSVRWLALDASGGLSISFCVCAVIPMWASAGPEITSVTPDASVPMEYAPRPGPATTSS